MSYHSLNFQISKPAKKMVADTIKIKKPGMNSFLFYILDKWALIGFTGMLLNIISLLENADLPDITGFSGLTIVFFSIYQKWRDDRRKQQKHETQIKLIEKMMNGKMDVDNSILSRFMDDDVK